MKKAGEDDARRGRARLVVAAVVCVVATSLVTPSQVDGRVERPTHHTAWSGEATTPLTIDALLELGDRVLRNASDAYPEAIYGADWSTQVLRRDVLDLGELQRACVDHKDAIVSMDGGASLPNATGQGLSILEDTDDDETLLGTLRSCATIDVYMPRDTRGQGYCEDASAYTKYLRGRILPDWVFTRTFHDQANNRTVTYHQLCPKTPLLLLSHYWNGIRDRHDWPPTKPLYLMPNIEMYELRDTHYLQADLILCKTAVCATHLTKWLAQEGNPRRTQVLYTRFTSSDVATNALVSLGFEDTTDADGWPQRHKNFDDIVFVHTAGTSFWKGTRQILDCWTTRPDLPLLRLFMDEEIYATWYDGIYGEQIEPSANIQLHTGAMDSVSFGRMVADSAFFLCTSMMEGYGHYINHARASGGLIITTDAPPMNELVKASSGVLVNVTRVSYEGQFLGGSSDLEGALRNVTGFVAAFSGSSVCDAVDSVVRDLDGDERRRRADRARQQFFFDTAYFARKMGQLLETIRPQAL